MHVLIMSLDLSENKSEVLVVMTTLKDQANEHVTPAKDETHSRLSSFCFMKR